jgi:hypothetical protein
MSVGFGTKGAYKMSRRPFKLTSSQAGEIRSAFLSNRHVPASLASKAAASVTLNHQPEGWRAGCGNLAWSG